MVKEASVAPRERVNIVYRPTVGPVQEDVELPLKIMVLSDFTGRADDRLLEQREPISVTANTFNEVMAGQGIALKLRVPDRLGQHDSEASRVVSLRMASMHDFEPDAIVTQLPELAQLIEVRDALKRFKDPLQTVPAFRSALQAALGDLQACACLERELESTEAASETSLLTSLRQHAGQAAAGATTQTFRLFVQTVMASGVGAAISGIRVDQMLADLDATLSAQVNAILHHPEFQTIESAWRSLKFLVDSTDFRQNIIIEVLPVSKEELLADFEDTPELTKSGLYKHIYTAEYGQYGGKPVAVMVANYDLGPGPKDMQLLSAVASVAAMAHAPFIAAAGKDCFGIDDWEALPNLKDLKSIFEMPQYARWRRFRDTEDARYVALTLPRFLLRVPYGPQSVPTRLFCFVEETASNNDFCWGNTAFALASRMVDSYAQVRWCANIIGPQGGGSVDNLPIHTCRMNGQEQTRIPTQVLISERREYELAEEGFIALAIRKGTSSAAFFSANACLRAKSFANTPEGKEAEKNYRLSLQLPYMMIMNRLAHYIKIIQREHIGTWKDRNDLERELNKWISQYVTEMDDPDPVSRSKRPLRMARLEVQDIPGESGWYAVRLLARPHFKYMGSSFTLSLMGKLDKQ